MSVRRAATSALGMGLAMGVFGAAGCETDEPPATAQEERTGGAGHREDQGAPEQRIVGKPFRDRDLGLGGSGVGGAGAADIDPNADAEDRPSGTQGGQEDGASQGAAEDRAAVGGGPGADSTTTGRPAQGDRQQ